MNDAVVNPRHSLIALLCILGSSLLFLGYSGGITGVTLKNGNGCTCHAPTPSPGVNVVISGPDTLNAGQTGTFRVTITGGPLAAAGTNLAASRGTLDIIAGEGLRKQGDELTHVEPKTPENQAVAFQFSYTAAATLGTDTLYANGNSVNLSGSNIGDQWNFASKKSVVVKAATDVADGLQPMEFSLDQNYPNPFNPSTTIGYALPATAHVRLEIYDATGRQVADLVNETQSAGRKSVVWSPSTLPTGAYYYRLIMGSIVETKKLLFVK